jgi:hypothetical protein
MSDNQPPVQINVYFTDRYVDTSAGDAEVGVSVEAWDPNGLASAALDIDGPNGLWRNIEFEEVAEPGRRLRASFPVPVSTPAGDYRVVSLSVSDGEGNGRTLSGAQLSEAEGRKDLPSPSIRSASLSLRMICSGVCLLLFTCVGPPWPSFAGR